MSQFSFKKISVDSLLYDKDSLMCEEEGNKDIMECISFNMPKKSSTDIFGM